MDEIIRLFKEVDEETLFFAGVFVAIVIWILISGIAEIAKNRRK